MKRIPPFGLTNKIFLKKNFLYKKSNRHSDYFLNREDEKKFYENFGQELFLKIPQTIQKKLGHWWSVMPFYEEAKTLPKDKLNSEQLQRVKALIDQLHDLKLELTIFDPEAFLNLFVCKVGIIPELESLCPRVQMVIHDYYFEDHALVISHNDLIRENILILNNEFHLIDFEYVSLNHYLFDYASFISESLNQEEAIEFKKILNLTAKEMEKLESLILYQNFLWAHWAKYMYQKTREPIYQEIMRQKIAQTRVPLPKR